MSDTESVAAPEPVQTPETPEITTKKVLVCRRQRKTGVVIERPLKVGEEPDSVSEPEPVVAEKKKRVVSQKTLDALAKGRELRDANAKARKEAREKLAEEWAMKKANNKIKKELEIKKAIVGDDDVDSDEDVKPVIAVQKTKPKKKKVVYLPAESDSEEEIIYKRKPVVKKELPPAPQRIFW